MPRSSVGSAVPLFELVAEDLADRRRQGAELRLDAVGQVDVLQPLEHLLAREVVVAASSNVTIENDRPNCVCENMRTECGSPLSPISSGIVTCFSTSSAA